MRRGARITGVKEASTCERQDYGPIMIDNVLVDFEPIACPGDKLTAYDSGCACKAGGEVQQPTII